MNEMKFLVPTLFGLEGLAGEELRRLGMENVRVEDRRVLFTGDERALAKANIALRTGERIMVCWPSSPQRPSRSSSRACTTPIWRTISPETASSP